MGEHGDMGHLHEEIHQLEDEFRSLEFNRPYETEKLRELATEIYEKKVQLAESDLQFLNQYQLFFIDLVSVL